MELEEAIKHLKALKYYYEEDINEDDNKLSFEAIKTVLQALEDKDIFINKLESGEDFTSNQVKFIEKNFIPKKKIEDKIKKYKEMSDDFYIRFLESNRLNKDIRDTGFSCDRKVEVLNELLEEE